MNRGIRIRLVRTIQKKSQTTLAREIGVSQSLISMLESDKVIPGEALKEKIAKALNSKPEQLFP